MRKYILFLSVIIASCFMAEVVYAGSINEHEQAIIDAASEEYEYNGSFYKVDQKYIDRLVEYLSQDHIDITAGDKQILIQLAYDNIELGVRDGYLRPIDNMNAKEEHGDTGIEPVPEDTVKEILASLGKDISDVEEYIPTVTNSDTATSDTKPIINKEEDKNIIINNSQAIIDSDNSLVDNSIKEDVIEDDTDIIEDDTDIIEYDTDIIEYDTDIIEDDKDIIEDEIIAQTGFSLIITLYMMIGLGALMIIGIYIAIRYNYLSNAYE